MSRGRKLKTKSSLSILTGFSSPVDSACSGAVNVAKETRSPKFCFMNSEIFVFNSSGEGKGGGGGFCSMRSRLKGRAGIYHRNEACKSASPGSDLFIPRSLAGDLASELLLYFQIRRSWEAVEETINRAL